MIHSSKYYPRIIPVSSSGTGTELHRIQGIDGNIVLREDKIYEVAREDTLGYRKIPGRANLTLRQLEYGSNAIFKAMGNVTANKIELTDFKTSAFDIIGFMTDDDGTFLGTVWYPEMRLSGFSVNANDPEGLLERSFSVVGENPVILDGKYLICKEFIALGGTGEVFTITGVQPNEDPDFTGRYLFAVFQNGEKLTYSTDYTFAGSNLTIVGTTVASDIIKVYYASDTFNSSESLFTLNDDDLVGIQGDSMSIELTSGEYLYRIQNCGIDVSFDRTDYTELGRRDKVQRGVRDTNVRISLQRKLEDFTIERTLRDVDSTYGKIDVTQFLDTNTLTIKLYSDYTKDTFKMGYRFTNLACEGMDASIPLRDYLDQNLTLIGTSGFVSSVIGDFA